MTAPRVGERFGRYRLDRQVGMGGMGVVYAATDTRLSRTVAVKVISARHAAGEGFRRRFEREADTLARLDSPHVITIYDAGEVDGHPYIATQFVGGGDLGHALAARGALPVPAAVEITRQLAEALHDAHQAGVVHRDIKPSNVLLRDTDATRLHAYLCDFGIAQDEGGESLTTADGVVGTWAYLAPERLDGAPAGQVTDIYSLGCLLWACLTGGPPYSGSDYFVAQCHQHAPIRQLTTTGSHLDDRVLRLNRILARALAKRPDDRYMSELAAAGTVRIGVRYDTPGLGYQEPGGGDPVGFDIEVAKILAAGLGIDADSIEWVETTSVDREPYLRTDTVDLVLAYYTITDERREVVGQAGPYLSTGLQFLVPQGSDVSGADDLQGEAVCAIDGSTTAEVVKANGMKVVSGPTIPDCVDLMRAGEATAVTGDGAILLGYDARYAGDFELVGRPPLSEERIGVGYSLDHPEMCQWITDTLATAESSGALTEAFEATLGASGEPAPPFPAMDDCP